MSGNQTNDHEFKTNLVVLDHFNIQFKPQNNLFRGSYKSYETRPIKEIFIFVMESLSEPPEGCLMAVFTASPATTRALFQNLCPNYHTVCLAW